MTLSIMQFLAQVQNGDEPAATRDVSIVVLLGAIATIIGTLTGLLTLARWFRKSVENQVKRSVETVNAQLDTGNGQSIGRMAKLSNDKLKSVESVALINANRIEALDARVDTIEARLSRHEFMGHPNMPSGS